MFEFYSDWKRIVCERIFPCSSIFYLWFYSLIDRKRSRMYCHIHFSVLLCIVYFWKGNTKEKPNYFQRIYSILNRNHVDSYVENLMGLSRIVSYLETYNLSCLRVSSLKTFLKLPKPLKKLVLSPRLHNAQLALCWTQWAKQKSSTIINLSTYTQEDINILQ